MLRRARADVGFDADALFERIVDEVVRTVERLARCPRRE